MIDVLLRAPMRKQFRPVSEIVWIGSERIDGAKAVNHSSRAPYCVL